MDLLSRNKIIKLRKKGKSYSEIQKILNNRIPKSTLSYWCNKLILDKNSLHRLEKMKQRNLIKARVLAVLQNKKKQEMLLKEIENGISHMKNMTSNKDILKMLLAFLHLGEGAKWKSHRGLMLGSSDPTIIQLYMKFLKICYGIDKDKLRCRISYRADQDIRKLERYWAKITGVSLNNFYKTIPDPRTIGKVTRRKDYKGVCVVTCSGTRIQLELEMIPKIILAGL